MCCIPPEHVLVLVRQLFLHLTLQAAQQEGAQHPMQAVHYSLHMMHPLEVLILHPV